MPKPNSTAFQRYARLVVVLAVTCIAIAVAGYIIGAELFWPIALLQYFPHALIAAVIVACIFSIKLARSWQLATIISVCVVVTFVMGFELNTGVSTVKKLRVMTYNVKSYLTVDEPEGVSLIAREIAIHDADIIVLQDAREVVAMVLASPASALAIFDSRQIYTYGQYLVASRYPLRDCSPGSISYRGFPHSYVRCVAGIDGREVDLFTAHFVTPRDGLNAVRHERSRGIDEWKQNISDRMVQATSFASDLRRSSRPFIVAGDLNAPVHSLVVRALLDTGARDAFSAAGSGFGYTYGHSLLPGLSFLRIDHVLVSPEFEVIDCFVGNKDASTHRAVVADIFLKNSSEKN